MPRMIKYLAYAWAFSAAPIVLVTFMGMGPLAKGFVAVTGLRVHPIYAGGEIARRIEHEGYQTLIHRPVFDGLVRERSTGFVQIEWRARDAGLPETIDEQIDFDSDGKADLRVRLKPGANAADIELLDGRIVSVDAPIRVPNGQIVRVNLKKSPN